MSSEPIQIERRAAQRFDFHLPVSVRVGDCDREVWGFTQNLAGRGALVHSDLRVAEGDVIALTLVMPAEITLTERVRMRCMGKVLRVFTSAGSAGSVVAVHFGKYEFLPTFETVPSTFARISCLHEHRHEREVSSHHQRIPWRDSSRS